jgi:SAM-dependent methyltransferase
MASAPLWPFQSPDTHEFVSAIIRRRSTNPIDVREAVLGDLDLSFARQVLDLGCGFGFMAEALAPRVAPDATLVGIDVWPSNERTFLERVGATGRRARFMCAKVSSEFPCPDRGYDLVVCSYALYFFVDALPEVARVLAPHGLFLTITHSDCSFVGLLQAVGLAQDGSSLLALTRRFSAENGQELLGRWFGEVARIDYPNKLCFGPEHADEFLAYLQFKLPLLVRGATPGDDLPDGLAHSAREALTREGQVVVEKNDAAFLCRSPKWP